MSYLDESNPYATTNQTSAVFNENSSLSEVASSLSKWQTLFAVLLFIGTGFMAIALLFSLVGVALGGGNNQGALAGVGMMIVMSLFVLVIYVLPGVLLWQARTAAAAYATSPTPMALEQLLRTQRQFWRLMGIMVLVVFGLWLLFMLLGLLGAVAFS